MPKEDPNGILTTNVVRLSDVKLVPAAKLAADCLTEGKVIALPTDTVYGVAALVQSKEAVQKLYDIKGNQTVLWVLGGFSEGFYAERFFYQDHSPKAICLNGYFSGQK